MLRLLARLLWSIWKWFLRLLTGQCELQRISASKKSLGEKTILIESSLRNSKSEVLRRIPSGEDADMDSVARAITKEKGLDSTKHQLFLQQIRPSLLRILSVGVLVREVKSLSSEPYSQDDEKHEEMLLKLWNQLMPSTPLEARKTKQWQDIGFQGNNPATDFRGMGVLSLHCLLNFSSVHQDKARAVLSHSHHPQFSYPLAIVSISLTQLLHSWLTTGCISAYLYTNASVWPIPVGHFMEMHSYLMYKFDEFWFSKEPEDVMAFPRIREEFSQSVLQQLKEERITLQL